MFENKGLEIYLTLFIDELTNKIDVINIRRYYLNISLEITIRCTSLVPS
jgi:hypothetical protein